MGHEPWTPYSWTLVHGSGVSPETPSKLGLRVLSNNAAYETWTQRVQDLYAGGRARSSALRAWTARSITSTSLSTGRRIDQLRRASLRILDLLDIIVSREERVYCQKIHGRPWGLPPLDIHFAFLTTILGPPQSLSLLPSGLLGPRTSALIIKRYHTGTLQESGMVSCPRVAVLSQMQTQSLPNRQAAKTKANPVVRRSMLVCAIPACQRFNYSSRSVMMLFFCPDPGRKSR